MKIALIQQHATPDVEANLERGLGAARGAARDGAEVICFAELAFEPFYPQHRAKGDIRKLAQPVPGPITDAFSALAKELGVVFILNLFERDGNATFDSSPVIDRDGALLGITRMAHITDYACFHEQDYYAEPEQDPPVFETAFGRIGIAICYDRHYPEYTRALALRGADVIVVPQAGAVGEWPEGLYEAEMRVAAFQNGCFVALCNRVGKEERLEFAGESFVCDPDGHVLDRAPAAEDAVLHVDLDLATIGESHAKRLFLRDRRPELYSRWLVGDSTRRAPGVER